MLDSSNFHNKKFTHIEHKEFQLAISLKYFGLPQILPCLKFGRPVQDPLNSRVNMNTPNGAKRMKKDGEQRSAEVTRNLFQGSSKKSKYPTNRNSPNTAEKGLPTTRTLFPYPPHLKMEWDPNEWSNDHQCQICTLRGPIFPHNKFRNGRTNCPKANRLIGCQAKNCPKRYCSHACFNLWHYGVDHTPTEEEFIANYKNRNQE